MDTGRRPRAGRGVCAASANAALIDGHTTSIGGVPTAGDAASANAALIDGHLFQQSQNGRDATTAASANAALIDGHLEFEGDLLATLAPPQPTRL